MKIGKTRGFDGSIQWNLKIEEDDKIDDICRFCGEKISGGYFCRQDKKISCKKCMVEHDNNYEHMRKYTKEIGDIHEHFNIKIKKGNSILGLWGLF